MHADVGERHGLSRNRLPGARPEQEPDRQEEGGRAKYTMEHVAGHCITREEMRTYSGIRESDAGIG